MAQRSLNNNVRVPVVFDNLIAKHDLPPLIGIFVDPGVLPALSDQAQSRFERVFEYDSLSDRYSPLPAGGADSRGRQEVQPLEGS